MSLEIEPVAFRRILRFAGCNLTASACKLLSFYLSDPVISYWHGVRTLSDKTGLNKSTCSRARKELVAAGILRKGGWGNNAVYQLNVRDFNGISDNDVRDKYIKNKDGRKRGTAGIKTKTNSTTTNSCCSINSLSGRAGRVANFLIRAYENKRRRPMITSEKEIMTRIAERWQDVITKSIIESALAKTLRLDYIQERIEYLCSLRAEKAEKKSESLSLVGKLIERRHQQREVAADKQYEKIREGKKNCPICNGSGLAPSPLPSIKAPCPCVRRQLDRDIKTAIEKVELRYNQLIEMAQEKQSKKEF